MAVSFASDFKLAIIFDVNYPKNKYAIVIAAMTPAKSASKPQATA